MIWCESIFPHGTLADHQRRVHAVRECSAKLGRAVGILGDLQGPKIRIARFQNRCINLEPDQEFVLDAGPAGIDGSKQVVGVDYKQLPDDVNQGDILLLDDGRIELLVNRVDNSRIICTVKTGGELSDNKGINRKGGGLSAGALTAKDHMDLRAAAAMQVDYIAVSFVRNATDLQTTRNILNEVKATAGIIAKIERSEAIQAIDDIIQASDGVMIARGDLGVEIGDAEVPAIQKQIIERARALDKPVITATQMMESMIQSPVPTRAEVSDVANAVVEGTDAIMLSGETAVGRQPEKVVTTAERVCLVGRKTALHTNFKAPTGSAL